MPQDRISGRAANQWGHKMAKWVAQYLGTELLSDFSNEAFLGDERIVIKSAHQRTPQIGLSQATLERVQKIIAVLENPDNSYTIYKLNPTWYRSHMAPSRSERPSAQKVMMVQCKLVREEGQVMGIIPQDSVGGGI